tara:strand:+ start:231 stop:443 length:213 start_codon:yes stop_codon:yes gene_type:complete
MKDTMKNSIIGAFAIFGFITLISSSNNSPTPNDENKFELQVSNTTYCAYVLNKQTGDVKFYKEGKKFIKK